MKGPNHARQKASLRRNRGILAMKAANMNEAQWAQHHDPLYGVKGNARRIKSNA